VRCAHALARLPHAGPAWRHDVGWITVRSSRRVPPWKGGGTGQGLQQWGSLCGAVDGGTTAVELILASGTCPVLTSGQKAWGSERVGGMS
jgi:hypothetical protein